MKRLLKRYSAVDLLRSIFVLNIWRPNTGSPIRIEYLYAVLQHLYRKLSREDRVCDYCDFEALCRDLLEALPTFPRLEDFVPESDWGDIRYFFDGKYYKVFYGASLSNPIDFYATFEVVHGSLDEVYRRSIGRSAIEDLKACAALQDRIIGGIDQSAVPTNKVDKGYLEVPPEWFWNSCMRFLEEFTRGEGIDADVATLYSYSADDEGRIRWPKLSAFSRKAMEEGNCVHYFWKVGDRYYPVMPRNYLSVLHTKWGELFSTRLDRMKEEEPNIDDLIGFGLWKYVATRFPMTDIFGYVTAMKGKEEPHDVAFACAIHAGGQIVMVCILPVSETLRGASQFMEQMTAKLVEARNLLQNSPTRLGVWSISEVVEFHPTSGERALQPVFIVTMPHLSARMQSILLPQDFPASVIAMDQLLGVLDEVHGTEELASFLEFSQQLRDETSISPLNSPLDLLAAFRDYSGVLIEGATVPDYVYIPPTWGTAFRFQSLSNFWKSFPQTSPGDHPRSWEIVGGVSPKSLKSKRERVYFYYETIGHTTFSVNCPVPLFRSDEGPLVDSIMHCLVDALTMCSQSISTLEFTKSLLLVRVFCVSTSVTQRAEELSKLRGMLASDKAWSFNVTGSRPDMAQIVFVYDEDRAAEILREASDRSIQVDLLTDLLVTLQTVWQESRLDSVLAEIEGERGKPSRFRLFEKTKEVSFPQHGRSILAGDQDHKLANRSLAEIASKLGVRAGTYSGEDAKQNINNLIEGLRTVLDHEISMYELEQSLRLLLSGVEGLVHEYESKTFLIEKSVKHEVEYDRSTSLSRGRTDFLREHRTYRYLIEKFVQLSPNGPSHLTETGLKRVFALSSKMLDLYTASDILHNGLMPAALEIGTDHLVSVSYGPEVSRRERIFGSEDANIRLGLVGRRDDVPELPEDRVEFLDGLDSAFESDLGFGIRNVAEVLTILTSWAERAGVPEAPSYKATAEKIGAVCASQIRGFRPSTIVPILSLLTLSADQVVRIAGNAQPAPDIPVWEFAKREARYTVNPIVAIGGVYYWGPYTTQKARSLWMSMADSYKLPLPIDAPSTKEYLRRAHETLTRQLELKIAEIVGRFTNMVERNVYIIKLDPGAGEIGDCDVLACFPRQRLMINIESKIIDPALCFKDTRRIAEKIFGRKKLDGSLEEGYLAKVEKRHDYLKANGQRVARLLNWDIGRGKVKVVSLFVTQRGYWWTRFPLTATEIRFLECRLLHEELSALLVKGN
ncbi:hypothetical protein KQH82_02555 [bacterium]|nr:hypothetical protein [bacterium]